MIFMYTKLITVHGIEISHVIDVAGKRQDIFEPAATTSNLSKLSPTITSSGRLRVKITRNLSKWSQKQKATADCLADFQIAW